MKDLRYLFDLFDKSSVTVIGYTSKTEHIKDDILSKLGVYRIGEIYPDRFNAKQLFRDVKLSSLFGETNSPTHYHLDIGDINADRNSTLVTPLSRLASDIIDSIRSESWNIYHSKNQESEFGLDFDDCEDHKQIEPEPHFRLIVTSQCYTNNITTNNIMGGPSILYTADLALVIEKQGDKKIAKIIKNRFDGDNIEINLDELDNYNYICNHEYSK